MKQLLRFLVACGAALAALQSQAQTITFDFDNAPAHAGLPIDVTAGGLTAHLSGSGAGFSIQQAGVLGFTPLGFSGNCVYPDSVFPADLTITFPVDMSDFSIMYSPEEYGCDSSATMRVTAYEDGVKVGTNTTTAPNPGTWPTGTLKFNNGKPFDMVVIHYDKPPVTGGDWGPVFMADNMKVTVSTIPDAVDDSYNVQANTSKIVPAATGVMANDEAVAGATAVLVTPPVHGTLSLATDGSFTYIPNSGYVGTDSFTYKDTLPKAASNIAKVSLNVLPLINGVALTPSSALSGSIVKGTVSVSIPAPLGGLTLNLSSNLASAAVPAVVKIGAGKTSGAFSFTAGSVTAASSGLVSATLGDSTMTAPITIYPLSNLLSISAAPNSIVGGGSSTVTVTLDRPVPTGTETIILASGNPVVTVPMTLKISAGSASGKFVAKSIPVSSTTTVALSASFNGTKLTETLTVNIPPMASLTLLPTTVRGGSVSTATITLKGAAGPSGAEVQITSSSTAATVPLKVTVPAGAKTVTFNVTTSAVVSTISAKITASYGGVSKSANLTITP